MMSDLDVIADEAINLARMVAGFAAARPAATATASMMAPANSRAAAGMPSPFATDAVLRAERDVIKAAKAWAAGGTLGRQEEDDLLDALDALKNVENAR